MIIIIAAPASTYFGISRNATSGIFNPEIYLRLLWPGIISGSLHCVSCHYRYLDAGDVIRLLNVYVGAPYLMAPTTQLTGALIMPRLFVNSPSGEQIIVR